MSPLIIIISILGYFSLLMMIAWYTSRNANNDSYFLGNKSSPWYAVAFGMIGDSLSGVTFISLPGTVNTGQFSYMQMVLGYLVGYFIIARVLLPLYYRLNLISIYSYLNERFGLFSQKTGSFYFLISRIIGAALRLYLAAGVIQLFVFDSYGVPFVVTVALIIVLMLLYTYRGGIKTLVWTDTLQSGLLLLGVILSITAIMSSLDFGFVDVIREVKNSKYSQVFFWDWKEKSYFFKQFLSGAFIAVVMTGLDQNMMQKNLSCPDLKSAQKNIYWFSIVLVFVNLFFLSLGALLYIFAEKQGIQMPINPETGKIITDKVFPTLALGHLGVFAAIVFIIGLTAATFSSADSVLTTLTTSFCIDFLHIDEKEHFSEKKKTNIRHMVHIGFAFVLLITILLCEIVPKTSVLDAIFTVAAYTYGPLLGLFAFGLFTKLKVKDVWVPLVSILSVVFSYLLRENSEQWFAGYKFGYELLLINGLFTFIGLMIISKRKA
ncbi:MAG: sodium:solute symporter [Bacteroidetes bacterium]|nr:sodium:solute symporter [Bacteroidota bacterium]